MKKDVQMANEVSVNDSDNDLAECAQFHVCTPATIEACKRFPDAEFDFCCECGQKVLFRPGGPKAPKKICLPCASPGLEESFQKNKLHLVVSPVAAELMARKAREQ